MKWFPIIVLLFAIGCTILIQWNPVYNGIEFDEEISFNYEDIGIVVEKFGFWSANHSPTALLTIQNFRLDTIAFVVSDFNLVVTGDTLKQDDDTTHILKPGQNVSLTIQFHYRIKSHSVFARSKKPLVHLLFPVIRAGLGEISPPTIGFVPRYKYDKDKLNYETEFAN